MTHAVCSATLVTVTVFQKFGLMCLELKESKGTAPWEEFYCKCEDNIYLRKL